MEVSCDEGVASHVGPESCGGVRKGVVEALTGERAGWVLSSEILNLRDADAVMSRGRPHRSMRKTRGSNRIPRSRQTPGTHRSIPRGSREIPRSTWGIAQVRAVNLQRERRR